MWKGMQKSNSSLIAANKNREILSAPKINIRRYAVDHNTMTIPFASVFIFSAWRRKRVCIVYWSFEVRKVHKSINRVNWNRTRHTENKNESFALVSAQHYYWLLVFACCGLYTLIDYISAFSFFLFIFSALQTQQGNWYNTKWRLQYPLCAFMFYKSIVMLRIFF